MTTGIEGKLIFNIICHYMFTVFWLFLWNLFDITFRLVYRFSHSAKRKVKYRLSSKWRVACLNFRDSSITLHERALPKGKSTWRQQEDFLHASTTLSKEAVFLFWHEWQQGTTCGVTQHGGCCSITNWQHTLLAIKTSKLCTTFTLC